MRGESRAERGGIIRVVTCQDIVAVLQRSGLAPGDKVMVHSSLKSFGHVEGDADTVIEALTTVIGPSGTLIMPTFTLSFLSAQAPVLDLVNTPSETGRITEVFRLRKNVSRSKHITHSIAAWGRGAAEVTGLAATTAWGKDSPFQWLLDNKGKILLLGVGYKCCTLIHKAEETLQVPYRRMISFPGAKTILPDGRTEDNHSRVYYLRQGFVSDWSRVIAQLDRPDVTKTGSVNTAQVRLADARDIYQVVLEMVKANPTILLGRVKRCD